jgi:Rps23 Pro-64 3,4-dihydroxylase Tpa1-like proline 4-hydroxylase
MKYINISHLKKSILNFSDATPFSHCVIDNFLNTKTAEDLENEFPEYTDPSLFSYKNSIEDKKVLNDWNKFPPTTYKIFSELMSDEFVTIISELLGCKIYVDHGLHGGGWHMHGPGGNLNPHLDYNIHPKLGLLRKINIIIYLSSSLEESHGGHLGLWEHSSVENCPGQLVSEILPKFNRAVMFDTTQNSWHGISQPLTQPEGIYRKSLAIYYLTDPSPTTDSRERALFAPRENQKNNPEIAELIKLRADKASYYKAYKKD